MGPALPPLRLLLVVWLAPALAMAGLLGGYALLAYAQEAVLRTALATLALLTVVSAGCNLVLQRWLLAPLRRLEHLQRASGDFAQADPEDLRRAFTLHRPLTALVLMWWLVGTLVWIAVGLERFGRESAESVLRAAGAAGLIGLHAATATYYLLYAFIGRRIAPTLLGTGRIDHLRGHRDRLYLHVMALAVVLGVLAPLTGSMLETLGTGGLRTLYAGGILFFTGAVQTWTIAYLVGRPAGELLGCMRRVRDGDLDTKATVRNLDTFGELASGFNEMTLGLRQHRFLRETFGRYLSRQVAEAILAGRVELGGELREATVLFSDIRGFTRLCETLPPQEVVGLLNAYFDRMVDCVFQHGGSVDKFIGDALLAVFGVPVSAGSAEADAGAALRCALDMLRRLDVWNEERRAAGLPTLQIGIGLHTGPLVAGNVGSERFMNYTVVGDTVNVASRIEGQTKELGERILVSETTRALAPADLALFPVQEVTLRGRSQPITLFGLRDSAAGRDAAEPDAET